MKVYTFEELWSFCERAADAEDYERKSEQAEQFIKSRPYLSEKEKDELLQYLFVLNLSNKESEPDFWDDYSKDYSPSNPWDAPGMRISDFITGVQLF